MKRFAGLLALGCIVAGGFTGSALATTTTITPGTLNTGDTANAGTATIVSLTGLGGNLESGGPSLASDGVLKLTTTSDVHDRAEAIFAGNLGNAVSTLGNIQLSYSYYKTDTGEQFAAPSLKIGVYDSGYSGSDHYGQLIYEPTWNQGNGSSAAVPTDAWQTVSIDSSTGSGNDSSGGWWWSGGLGILDNAGSGGGPPIKSLSEWVTAFGASDSNFDNAIVSEMRVGVGTYNKNQIDYTDAISYTIDGGSSVTYNFATAAAPLPASVWGSLSLLGLAGGMMLIRRRLQRA